MVRHRIAYRPAELEQFAYVCSHDFQEPLRMICLFGELVQQECSDALGEPGNDYVRRMRNAAERMRALIFDSLTFTRVNRRKGSFCQVDLHAVAQDVVSSLDTVLRETGGRVEIAELPTIEARPAQMRQLLQNLIDNGLKFHRRDHVPVVRIHARMGEKNDGAERVWEITVEDNGIGFDGAYAERVFAPFHRLHGRDIPGSGLGLATCRKIVEEHHGMITATSAPDCGSRFVVTLPSSQPKDAREAEPCV